MRSAGLRTRALGMFMGGLATALTGCDGFFVPLTGTTGGGGNGTLNYAYVLNSNQTSANIAGYALGTGKLVALNNSPYAVNLTPTALVVTPDNKFVYVGGNVSGVGIVDVYAIQSDGSLQLGNGGTAVSAVSAVSMDVSPDGNFLFMLDANVTTTSTTPLITASFVDVFQINKTTGALTTVGSTSYSATSATLVPHTIKAAASYVIAAVGTGGIEFFNLNSSTGQLTNAANYGVGGVNASVNGVTIDKAAAHLYAARSGIETGVVSFSIAQAGLSQNTNSPFAAGAGPAAVVLDPTEKYEYVANRLDNNISAYTVGSGGFLTLVAGTPFASGAGVVGLAAESTGTYLVAVSSGGTPDVELYTIGTSGGLTAASTISPATTSGPVAVAVTH